MQGSNPTEPELLLPQLVNRYSVKSIYPLITILYFMAKFVEMDYVKNDSKLSQYSVLNKIILIFVYQMVLL
jgi:hypothetical protein